MKKIACQYAIARFAPYVETGEFANVGIVLAAPKRGYFDFKLEIQRYGRITRFFEKLDKKIYKTTLNNLQHELSRVQEMLERNDLNDTELTQGFFNEITRPRETILRFSDVRTVLTENPAKTVRELFGFYVEHNFVNKEYREATLERGVRAWLLEAQLAKRFTQAKVGDDLYQANFPFVQFRGDKPVKIIKPLHLAQDEPNKILEHGGAWLFKIQQLRKRNKLPDKVLFATDGPAGGGKREQAFQDIAGELRDTGVYVEPYTRKEKVIEFALE